MKKTLYMLALAAVCASCAGSYHVEGSSSISALDGSKLYLKTIKNSELKSIDSCEVIHGEFHFSGTLDSVRMATLYMGDDGVMPIVLEQGDIVVKIEAGRQTVSGTPLNDTLYVFIEKHNRLSNQMNELSHKQSQMLLEGIDEETINEQLSTEAAQIASDEDQLVTKFIEDNFDNVLGPGVFMMITSQYRYPILTPQIEALMTKATPAFKEDPYVKDYYRTAQENEQRMNGLEDTTTAPTDSATPAAPVAPITPAAPATAEEPSAAADPVQPQPPAPLTTVPQK